jgi:hypothetical protein
MNLHLQSYKYLYETIVLNTRLFLFTYLNMYMVYPMVYHVVYSVFILEFFSKLKKMFYAFLMLVSNGIIFRCKFSIVTPQGRA